MNQPKESILTIELKGTIPKLINKEFAFACWRLPNRKERLLAVCLSEPQATDNIGGLDAGFLVNSFNDNHPKKPLHIKADIVFKDNEKPRIDPRINDNQLSRFVQVLGSDDVVDNLPGRSEASDQLSFTELVDKAVLAIKNGHFEKVVLSRYQDVEIPSSFSIERFFDTVCASYPNAFCSLIHLPGNGIWIGASPELLISNNEHRFKTTAIAGTKKLEDEQLLAEIAWTQKEIEEQAFVSRYVINCFKKIRLREFHEHGPKAYKAGNLSHLKTEFEVNYEEIQFEGLADQMLELLHPTSAVCGMPLEPAQQFIEQEECYDRSLYSGFIGPVNFDGSTDLFVNLRCMSLAGSHARLYAGAGITEDSNALKEMEETQLKMEILKGLLH